MILLVSTPYSKENETKRFLYLLGFGLLQGLSIGPLIDLAFSVDPSIVATALWGTVAVFACFSASALLAQRRQFLFLYGILGSAVSLMCLLGFLNLFIWSSAVNTFNLYLGLLVFCGFVIVDTQLVIEKASAGSRDYVLHSMELFLDFVAIFVRLLIILTKNRRNDNNNNNNNKRK
eukprot:TRINITY_DN2186_c1_g1_i2.p1 TRINITY_DN2186_c1_g1~~TRINITY_DN2186_c1_g1_i2.p1  ORF type:complete len:176 (-),score=33.49 TRINITY_DN2186_c1_g1_i2:170-697(-)